MYSNKTHRLPNNTIRFFFFFFKSLMKWIIWCSVNTYSILFHGTESHAISYGLSIWLTRTHCDLCLKDGKSILMQTRRNISNSCLLNVVENYKYLWHMLRRANCNYISLQAEALHLLSSCGHKPHSHEMRKVRNMWHLWPTAVLMLSWT